MNITYLELPTKDLHTQWEYYSNVLELPVQMTDTSLEVVAGAYGNSFHTSRPLISMVRIILHSIFLKINFMRQRNGYSAEFHSCR